MLGILLHKKTGKYSFMTLTCQAGDDFFIFLGIHGTQSGSNPQDILINRRLFQCLMMVSANYCVSTATFRPIVVTQYLNLLHFRPENGVSKPLRPKVPKLGVIITTLR